jgi:hypothetical protein
MDQGVRRCRATVTREGTAINTNPNLAIKKLALAKKIEIQ